MRYQGSTRYERHLVDQVRSVMAAGNPVPGGAGDYADLPEAQERVVALHAAEAAWPRQQERRMPGAGRAAPGRPARRRFGVALSRPARRAPDCPGRGCRSASPAAVVRGRGCPYPAGSTRRPAPGHPRPPRSRYSAPNPLLVPPGPGCRETSPASR